MKIWCSEPVDALEDAIEEGGLQRAGLRQLDADRGQNLAQAAHLLERGLVMHAIDQRRARFLQRLGGRDVGEDHEFLDQPVRLEPLRDEDRSTVPSALSMIFRSGRSRSSGSRASRARFSAA